MPTAKPHTTNIKARINLKLDATKHKTLALQILARDNLRIKAHRKCFCPCGPCCSGKNDVMNRLLVARPFSNDSATIDVTNANVTYTIEVGVGADNEKYTLLIDTGSSNTFIGADKVYKPNEKSAKDTGNTVKVSYGSGSFTGKQYIDRVALSDDLVIDEQGISVTTKDQAQGFNGVDGILGIGPVALTAGTVSDGKTVPTVVDNLFTKGTIPKNSISIFYQPTVSNKATLNGQLTFGGVKEENYANKLQYVDVTSKGPASNYWGIEQSISYGSSTLILKEGSAGITDTGTTLLYLPSDAYAAYKDATGAKLDTATGLLKLSKDQFKKLQTMYFKIGKETYDFVPDAQIWPTELNETLGGDKDAYYLVVADSGTDTGSGLDFINGFVWLQRFFSDYDTTDSSIGFAYTKYTKATTNVGGASSGTARTRASTRTSSTHGSNASTASGRRRAGSHSKADKHDKP